MEIELSVISFAGQPQSAGPSCRFGEKGGSIGRGAFNDLVLDGVGGWLQVSCKHGQFLLQNFGQQPVVVVLNGSTRCLVEPGLQRALNDGDELEIGLWRVRVAVVGHFVWPEASASHPASERLERFDIDDREYQLVGAPPPPHDVRLGAAAPATVGFDDTFIVHFTAYAADQEEVVRKQLAEQDPLARLFLNKRSCRWRTGTRVSVSLLHPGFACDDAEQALNWNGTIEVLDFVLRSDALPARRALTLKVSIEGVAVASISLLVEVVATPKPLTAEVRAETVAARTAFASYASADRGVVAHMVGAIERSAGIKVVTDYLHLLAGDRWQSALHRHIDQADLFLLFWSDEARRSSWVDWEWRTALRDKGEAAIQLHPLEPDVPAPPELAHLHFGSAHALVADYYRKRAHDEAQRQAAEARQAETRRAIERARLEGRPLDVLRALARLTRQWAGPSDASVAAAASIGDWFARFPISLAIAAIMEANERAYAWPVAPTLGAFCLSLDERLGQPELLVDGEQADIRAIWQARCSSHHDLLDYLSHCLRSCTEGDWHYAAPPREQRVPPSF